MITVYVVEDASRSTYRLMYRDPLTGKWVGKQSKVPVTANRRDAEREAGDWQRELNAGAHTSAKDVSWQVFRERLASELFPRLGSATAAAYTVALNSVERYLGTPKKLKSLDGAQISRLLGELLKAGLSHQTASTYLREIRVCLQWAIDVKLLPTLPAFPRGAKRGTGKSKGRPLATEEFERMLSAIPIGLVAKKKSKSVGKTRSGRHPPPRRRQKKVSLPSQATLESWNRFLRGLWLSGLRLGESLRLWWDQPHGDPEAIVARLDGRYPMFWIPAAGQKSGKEQLLPMAPEFAAFLEETPVEHRRGRVFRILGLRKRKDGQPSEIRGLVEISRRISDIGEAAHVVVDFASGKFASAHDLRRSFGHRWATRVLPQILQQMMRHKHIETTLTYYVGNLANETAEQIWKHAEVERKVEKPPMVASHSE